MREVTVSTGAAAYLPGTDVTLDLGTLHPSSHGALRLRLLVDDDVIVSADPIVGLLHRGAEKLFEVRDYRQIIMLANRHDWLSAFSSEVGVALAVERLLGLEVPERATWGRTLLCELNRIAALASYLSAGTGSAAAADLREQVLALLDMASGGRIHHMLTRIGGLARPLGADWLDAVTRTLSSLEGWLLDSSLDSLAGVAVLSRDDAVGFAVSGPVARGSGLDLDLRRDDPYLGYGELDVRVPVREAGDARARYEVIAGQIPAAAELGLACIERLRAIGDDAPFDVTLPKVVRAPEGSAYAWTENPSGINGYLVVSTADKTPWRCKLRSASFNNVQALSAALPGTTVEALPAALASFFYVVGDVDK